MMRHSTHPAPMQQPLSKRSAVSSGGLVASIAKSRETTLFVVLILLIAGTGLAKPQFLNMQNLRDVLLKQGYAVTYREVPGAQHEYGHWKAALPAALEALAKDWR